MKNVLLVILILFCMLMKSCFTFPGYKPEGEFYEKTSPCHGDAGVSEVISFESEKKSYEADGDITITAEIGIGHLENRTDEYPSSTFYITYQLYNSPFKKDDLTPIWEKRVDYSDSFYSKKYETSLYDKMPFIEHAIYPEFYPTYTEKVDILIPAEVSEGYLEITIISVHQGEETEYWPVESLIIEIERKNGMIILSGEYE